jgi:hypothetical protein
MRSYPGRRKTFRRLDVPPVVPLPQGMAHRLDLITDPTLRRRQEAG